MITSRVSHLSGPRQGPRRDQPVRIQLSHAQVLTHRRCKESRRDVIAKMPGERGESHSSRRAHPWPAKSRKVDHDAMTSGLADSDLPGYWKSADAAALRGQKWSLRYQKGRLGGALLAALSSAIAWRTGTVDLAATLIAGGFFIAFVCEIASWIHKPEVEWYLGRALAESVKTLAWRYAVAADPFGPHLDQGQAHQVMRKRLQEVAAATNDLITVEADPPEFTDRMEELRQAPFPQRREAYLKGRTEDQRQWYAAKARYNRHRALIWRIALVTAEVVALVLASLRIVAGSSVNFAGLLAAVIGAGAAWMALKQHTISRSGLFYGCKRAGAPSGTIALTPPKRNGHWWRPTPRKPSVVNTRCGSHPGLGSFPSSRPVVAPQGNSAPTTVASPTDQQTHRTTCAPCCSEECCQPSASRSLAVRVRFRFRSAARARALLRADSVRSPSAGAYEG